MILKRTQSENHSEQTFLKKKKKKNSLAPAHSHAALKSA